MNEHHVFVPLPHVVRYFLESNGFEIKEPTTVNMNRLGSGTTPKFSQGSKSKAKTKLSVPLKAPELIDLEKESGVNMSLLLTSSIGMASEGGEFAEIVKKCIFQGKPLDSDTIFHAKRELGDVAWYWINACRSLGLDPNSVLEENVNKLKSRYPGGEFDVHYSENRQEGDI